MVFFHVVGHSPVQKQKAFRREGEIWRSSVSEQVGIMGQSAQEGASLARLRALPPQ